MFRRLASVGPYLIGDTYSAANEGLKGRSSPTSRRSADRARSTRCSTSCIADDLRTVLWPLPSDDDPESWQLRARRGTRPRVLIGGSDAGAHLDRMCGAPYTTEFLADCLRGRQLVPLERAVQLITQAPAELFGLPRAGPRARRASTPTSSCSIRRRSAWAMRRSSYDLPGGRPPACRIRRRHRACAVNGRTVASRTARRRATRPVAGAPLGPRHPHRPRPGGCMTRLPSAP